VLTALQVLQVRVGAKMTLWSRSRANHSWHEPVVVSEAMYSNQKDVHKKSSVVVSEAGVSRMCSGRGVAFSKKINSSQASQVTQKIRYDVCDFVNDKEWIKSRQSPKAKRPKPFV
jgi:hypothetical protein